MKKKLVMVSLIMSAFFGTAQATLISTGPDTFGYSGNAIGSNLRDISASGAFISLTDDQTSGAIGMGFGFNFYGLNYTNAFVSSNGFMGFSPGMSHGCCSGPLLPDIDFPNNLIAGLWEDFNSPQGNIRTQTLGVVGSREFVVGFYDVAHYFNGPLVTFEMIIHEGTNNIELQYGNIVSDGGIHTIGIENLTGTDGLQVLNSSTLDFSNTGYLISGNTVIPEPAAIWLFGLGLIGLAGRRKKLVRLSGK